MEKDQGWSVTGSEVMNLEAIYIAVPRFESDRAQAWFGSSPQQPLPRANRQTLLLVVEARPH